MRHVLLHRFLVCCLSLFLVCVGTNAAVAQETQSFDEGSQLSDWEEQQLMELESHFHGSEFDYFSARVDADLDQEFLSEFAVAYYAGLNGNGSQALLAQKDAMTALGSERVGAVTKAASACAGRTGWRAFWPTIFLNSCQASALSSSLSGGAGVAGIAGLLTSWTGAGPLVSGVVAGALVVYSSLYSLCNSWGTGIQLFLNPAGIPICWAQ